VHVISILKHVVVIGESFFELSILLSHPALSSFHMLLATKRGFGNLMFPLCFTLLGGSFVFLDTSPSILFLVFPLFWVLWFMYDWQGFINANHNTPLKASKVC
jgi:hypothetical protein